MNEQFLILGVRNHFKIVHHYMAFRKVFPLYFSKYGVFNLAKITKSDTKFISTVAAPKKSFLSTALSPPLLGLTVFSHLINLIRRLLVIISSMEYNTRVIMRFVSECLNDYVLFSSHWNLNNLLSKLTYFMSFLILCGVFKLNTPLRPCGIHSLR